MGNSIDNRAYAGFFVRMMAYIIDCIIAFVAAGLIKLPFGIAAGVGLSALKANFLFQYSFIDVIGYLAMVGYFILMTYFTHSTLGKMLFRLEVITKDGDWTLINILYRETVGRFLSGLMNIGYLAVIISQTKQGFHDMLCDTYVVYSGLENVRKPVHAGASGEAANVSMTNVAVNDKPDDEVITTPEESRLVNSAFIMPENNVYTNDNNND